MTLCAKFGYTEIFLVLTSTAESLFVKSGFYQNEAKMPEKRLRISQTVMLKRAFGKALFQ